MTKAAQRFLTEALAGAWSDSCEPWENTAENGMAEIDADYLNAICEDTGEDHMTAQIEVVNECRGRFNLPAIDHTWTPVRL